MIRQKKKLFTFLLLFVIAAVVGWQWQTTAQNTVTSKVTPLTNTSVSKPARRPSFTPLNGDTLVLWWQLPLPQDEELRAKGIPWGRAQWSDSGFKLSKQLLYTRYGIPETYRLQRVPKDDSIAACMELVSFFRESSDAGISRIKWKQVSGERQFEVEPELSVALPFAIKGFPPPPKQWQDGVAGRLQYPVQVHDSYFRPDLLISRSGGSWYMVGIESQGRDMGNQGVGKIWFTKSADVGKIWQQRQLLNTGNFPTLTQNSDNELLLFYVDAGLSGYLGEWPDDAVGPTRPGDVLWPGTGSLMMQRSSDDGKTWGKPQAVGSDKRVIQSRAYVASDGRIWLTYVQSGPSLGVEKRTSLWLTSSKDGGKTWASPSQLTDGKYLDREPDLTVQDDKLLIAFSRSGRGINTNIWLAKVDLK